MCVREIHVYDLVYACESVCICVSAYVYVLYVGGYVKYDHYGNFTNVDHLHTLPNIRVLIGKKRNKESI